MTETVKNTEQALRGLLRKYNVRTDREYRLSPDPHPSVQNLWPGWELPGSVAGENTIPLLTWRLKRKFTELKKIVQDRVVEDPRMFRFNSTGHENDLSLKGLLYREMDLCEYIGGSRIVSMQAVITGNRAGNVIAKLENEILCSIEVSTLLPGGDMIDRHEIIARRGIAGDIVVDTMIPQSSIYTYTKNGEYRYRDVDEELFGFDESETDLIRSAFQVLRQPETGRQWSVQHRHLSHLVDAVFTSDKERRKIRFD